MHCVLDERLGVPVPLEDDALGLVVVEVNLVLQRAGVRGAHDLHALSGQALELLELALVKLESSDALKLTHGSGLQTSALLVRIDCRVLRGRDAPTAAARLCPAQRPLRRGSGNRPGRRGALRG